MVCASSCSHQWQLCSQCSAQWGSALVVCGQIFQHSSNYFTIWKITKMLISQPNLNGFAFCKKTPKCLSFASVFKHSPHFQLQFQEGPNLAAHFPTVQCLFVCLSVQLSICLSITDQYVKFMTVILDSHHESHLRQSFLKVI